MKIDCKFNTLLPSVPVFAGVLFVVLAMVVHWLGPLCGWYDFRGAMSAATLELNHHHGWVVLTSLLSVLVLFEPKKIMRFAQNRGAFLSMQQLCAIVALVSLFWLLGGGVSTVSNSLAMVFLICVLVWMVGARVAVMYSISAILGYLFIGYAFTIVKGMVFLRGVSVDAELIRADRIIFNLDLYRWAAYWGQKSLIAMWVADRIYLQLFSLMVFNVLACGYLGGRSLVRCYAFSLLYCYVIGVCLYFLAPAYGPFAYDPVAFAKGWSDGGWRVAEIQSYILKNTTLVGHCQNEKIAPFAYVAAMPSLHIAVPMLGFVLLWRWRLASLCAFVPLVLTVFSVLITGMHYGVDVIAGAALATGCAWLAKRRLSAESLIRGH